MNSGSIRIPARLEAADAVGEWIRDFIGQISESMDDRRIGRIELAVHELVVNTITHATTPDDFVDITAAAHGGRMNIELRDRGENVFDERAVVPKLAGEPKMGGYGLPIAKKLSTSLKYRRHGDENVWNAVFDLGV